MNREEKQEILNSTADLCREIQKQIEKTCMIEGGSYNAKYHTEFYYGNIVSKLHEVAAWNRSFIEHQMKVDSKEEGSDE